MAESSLLGGPQGEGVSPFPARSKISPLPASFKAKPVYPNPRDEEKMEALCLAVRSGTKADVAVYFAAQIRLKVKELEKIYFFAFHDGPKAERLKEFFYRAVDGRLTTDEHRSFALPNWAPAEELANFIALAIRIGLYSFMAKVTWTAIMGGQWSTVDEVFSVVPRQSGGKMSVKVGFASLAVQAAIHNGKVVEQILTLATMQVNNNADLACDILVQNRIPANDVLEAAMKTGLKAREEVYAALLEQLLASFAKPQKREWEKPQYSFTEERSGPKQDRKWPFFLIIMKASTKTGQISWLMKKYPPGFPQGEARYDVLRVARLCTGTEGFHLEKVERGRKKGVLNYFVDATYDGRPRLTFEEGSSVLLREVAVIKELPWGGGICVMSYVYGLGVKLDDILFVLHIPSAAVPLRFTEKSFYVSSKFKEIPLYAPAGLDFIDITVPIKELYQLYVQEHENYHPIIPRFMFQEECDLIKPLEELSQSEKRHDESLVEVMEQDDPRDAAQRGAAAADSNKNPVKEHKKSTTCEDPMVEVTEQYVEIKRKQTEEESALLVGSKNAQEFSISKCIAVLHKMKSIQRSERATAYKVFKIAENREIFLSSAAEDEESAVVFLRSEMAELPQRT